MSSQVITDSNEGTPVTGALSVTIGPGGGTSWELISVTVNFNTAPTTSEDMTLKLDSNVSAAQDTTIQATDPSVGSATDVRFLVNDRFAEGDKIVPTRARTNDTLGDLQKRP
ncbi:MAG: hypothetical protein ACYS76_13405 [Planctomycetota bacterium]|jgi:hypothetical protein